MEFHPKGHLFICTREGGVWRYMDYKWSLFANGLHEPLGIYIDQKNERGMGNATAGIDQARR